MQGFGSNVSLLCGDVRDPTLDLLDLRSTSIYVYSGAIQVTAEKTVREDAAPIIEDSPDGVLVKPEIGCAGGDLDTGLSLWVPHALRRMSALGREPNKRRVSVTKTHVSRVFDGTGDKSTRYPVDVTVGGHSSVISCKISANRFLGIATSAI